VLAVCVLSCASLVGADARGQSEDTYARSGGWRDRFSLSAGAAFVSHDTFALLRPSGTDLPGIDVEQDTGLAESTAPFRLEGYLRLGRRHRLALGYMRMNRDAVTRLTGEIEWDGEVFPVDAQVATLWDTRVLTFRYRFSVIQRESLDIGLSVGLFAMKVTSGIALGDSTDNVAADTAQEAPLPMLGASLEWELAPRFILRARGLYLALSISDTLDGHWGEAAAAVEWYPFGGLRQLGIGAGYNYANVDVDLEFGDTLRKEFQYNYRFSGPVLYGVLSF